MGSLLRSPAPGTQWSHSFPPENMARLLTIFLILSITLALIDGQRRWKSIRRTSRPSYNSNRRKYYSRNNNNNQIQRGRTIYSSGYKDDYASFRSSLEGSPNFFILRGGTFY